MVLQDTINHGVALFVGFIFAMLIEEAATQAAFDGILGTLSDNIVALYLVLVIALFATRMGGGAMRGR